MKCKKNQKNMKKKANNQLKTKNLNDIEELLQKLPENLFVLLNPVKNNTG